MIQIASLSREEREELFLNTAHKIGMPPAIVEKDFWVCYMFDYLFHRCAWKEKMVFKGGTSLSKAYHLIERFSEDIDFRIHTDKSFTRAEKKTFCNFILGKFDNKDNYHIISESILSFTSVISTTVPNCDLPLNLILNLTTSPIFIFMSLLHPF